MNDVTLREAPLSFTSNLDQDDKARKADTLNLLPYAEAMRDFIHECETPISIGIQGEWGIGRTSLMNMLRGDGGTRQSGLLDASLCKTISLDSWPYAQFAQNDNMAVACLYALTNGLGRVLEQGALLENETFHVAERILRGFMDARRVSHEDLLVLNGLPRHLGQATDVDRIVRVERVIRLDCTAEVVFERLRLNSGGDRGSRADDAVALVEEKLADFAERTAPLVEHYRERGAAVQRWTVGVKTRPEDLGP